MFVFQFVDHERFHLNKDNALVFDAHLACIGQVHVSMFVNISFKGDKAVPPDISNTGVSAFATQHESVEFGG